MMFEIRSPTNGMPVLRLNCAAIASPTSFDRAYDDSGRGSTVSSIGANSGGVSNGSPRTVSLDAQTTRPRPFASAAAKTLYVARALMRNVSAGGRISGAGIAARWTTASAPASASCAWP
jgi:hypothetical protein